MSLAVTSSIKAGGSSAEAGACSCRRGRHAPHDARGPRPCAITLPPASAMARAPAAPSEPMPVSTMPSAATPVRSGDAGKQRIDRGPAMMNRRLVVQTQDRLARGGPNHVAVARCDVDGGGLEWLPVDSLLGLAAGRTRQAPSKNCGEHRRHVLAMRTGTRLRALASGPSISVRACGPPVELPMAMMPRRRGRNGRQGNAAVIAPGRACARSAADPVSALSLPASQGFTPRPSPLSLRISSWRKSGDVVISRLESGFGM
jgi:hypothetical protein